MFFIVVEAQIDRKFIRKGALRRSDGRKSGPCLIGRKKDNQCLVNPAHRLRLELTAQEVERRLVFSAQYNATCSIVEAMNISHTGAFFCLNLAHKTLPAFV